MTLDLADMAMKREKIRIEMHGPAVAADTTPNSTGRAESGVLHIARLIGRQIAREQFGERNAKDRRSSGKRRDETVP